MQLLVFVMKIRTIIILLHSIEKHHKYKNTNLVTHAIECIFFIERAGELHIIILTRRKRVYKDSYMPKMEIE